VGGGERALQKLRLLAKTRARIGVVAASFSSEVRAFATANGLSLQARRFQIADLAGPALVVAAASDPALNREVAEAAKARAIPVNVVDAPDLSTVIVPAIVDRDPVVVAIGTEGTAPVIARDLRARIEALLPAAFGRIAALAGALRPRVRELVHDFDARRRLWERLLRGPLPRLAADHDANGSEALERELALAAAGPSPSGSVALIGCGPGDPDLLTLKALHRLQDADVLVYDRLVNPAILDYARRDAARIDVGKQPGKPSTSQTEINRILVREALKGQRVARLKGGDPLIFGRAAEEIAAVRAAGIEVEIIPGITAAHACAASVGLPLTLRGKVRHLSIVTGTSESGEPELDWPSLAGAGQALAIYMGLANVRQIEKELRRSGVPEESPVVIVENGTRPDERAIATTLADLSAAVMAERIQAPAVIFVGVSWQEAHLTRPARVKTFASPAKIEIAPTSLESQELRRRA
jgi:uroporphyrin-III C-methyltransferase/precorrin-2 dehydrogenase/sirohydrochlorin ferrochelatase